jgi:hypothetical protein
MKWRYSLRIMTVRCILVETTVPVRIRPRMETVPVKGHFLSILPKVSNSSSPKVIFRFVVRSRFRRVARIQHSKYFAIALSMLLSIFQLLNPPGLSIVFFARTDVAALNGGLGGTETQTNILVPSSSSLARSGALGLGLGVQEDVRLLLESTLRLDGQLGRPGINVSTKQCSSRYRAVLSCKTDILNYPSPGRYRN